MAADLLGAYRAAARDLAGARDWHADRYAAIQKSYVDGFTALTAELDAASRELAQAQTRLRAARTALADTEARAAQVWDELAGVLGRRRAARLGTLPEPLSYVDELALPGQRIPVESLSPQQELRRAVDVVRDLRRPPRAGAPQRAVACLPILGALCSALVVLGVRGTGAVLGGGNLLLDVFGQLLLFLAPFTGVPVAVAVFRHRYTRPPDLGGVGLTILGGMLASAVLATLY
jgi:hypothetical protein